MTPDALKSNKTHKCSVEGCRNTAGSFAEHGKAKIWVCTKHVRGFFRLKDKQGDECSAVATLMAAVDEAYPKE